METVQEFNSRLTDPSYLGDGVYAGFDGYHVILSTQDGQFVQNVVALDDQVQWAYLKYLEKRFNVEITVRKREVDECQNQSL